MRLENHFGRLHAIRTPSRRNGNTPVRFTEALCYWSGDANDPQSRKSTRQLASTAKGDTCSVVIDLLPVK